MSTEFFHPWKHSSSRKWLRVLYRRRFDSPIFVGLHETRPLQWRTSTWRPSINIDDIDVHTHQRNRTNHEFRARPITNRRDKTRTPALFRSKKNHWLWNGRRADNSMWRIFIKRARKINRKWRSFRLCTRDTCWAFHKQDVSLLSYLLSIEEFVIDFSSLII